MPKLSVHLVTWNGAKYIPYLFDSLRKQTFRDWEILVIDNASSDDTVAVIQKELVNFPVPSRVIVNTENKGFAGGHNQALRETNADYFLIINQDLFLEADCVEKVMLFIEQHQHAAAVAPLTLKWHFPDLTANNQIDSLGLKVLRNRRVIEIGEGEEWKADKERSEEVFGVSGAIVLLKRQAISEMNYLFDDGFGSYKEDVDLAFRLQSAGWKTYLITNTVAYHDRGGSGVRQKDDWSASENKLKQTSWVRYHSYKNHLMTLYKNEYWQNFLLDFFPILWYELKKCGWFLLFEPRVLKGLGEVWKMRKELKMKREKIKETRSVGWKQIRIWWKNV